MKHKIDKIDLEMWCFTYKVTRKEIKSSFLPNPLFMERVELIYEIITPTILRLIFIHKNRDAWDMKGYQGRKKEQLRFVWIKNE